MIFIELHSFSRGKEPILALSGRSQTVPLWQ